MSRGPTAGSVAFITCGYATTAHVFSAYIRSPKSRPSNWSRCPQTFILQTCRSRSMGRCWCCGPRVTTPASSTRVGCAPIATAPRRVPSALCSASHGTQPPCVSRQRLMAQPFSATTLRSTSGWLRCAPMAPLACAMCRAPTKQLLMSSAASVSPATRTLVCSGMCAANQIQ